MSDDAIPVNRGECRLRHALIEQRFGTLERDMSDVKRDVCEIRGALIDMRKESSGFYTDARKALVWILRITAIALVLVAAGRGMDVSWILGGV